MGRTGCFIVIDAMLERMKHEKSVDIYGHVTCMRAQRNYMVQTEDQYIFIHEALLEAATCGNTEVPARNLYAHIQKLTQPPPGETVTAMELEFKVGALLPSVPDGSRTALVPTVKNRTALTVSPLFPVRCKICLTLASCCKVIPGVQLRSNNPACIFIFFIVAASSVQQTTVSLPDTHTKKLFY